MLKTSGWTISSSSFATCTHLKSERFFFSFKIFHLKILFNFQIFHHSLIFEILKKLTSELGEKSVECVLLTLKSIGFALRKDDPMALKELIATLQTKTNEAPDELKNK